MRIIRNIFLVLTGFLMVSCSVSTPDSRISEVENLAPGRWAATSQARLGVTNDWVKLFGDRELSRLVDIGLKSAPDIAVIKERVEQARYDVVIAGASFKPQLGFTSSLQRNKVNFFAGSLEGSGVSQAFGTNFEVSWEPDIWGRARAGQSAVLGEFQAQIAEYRGAKALLAADICRAWFGLAEAREQYALALEGLRIRKQTAAAVQSRFERNLAQEGGSASQLRLAQTDIATAKALLSQRQGEIEVSKRQLELLLGRYPAANIKGRSAVPAIGPSPPVGLPSELLLRRPDILAAERRYASSGKRMREASLALYPSFPLTASAGTSTSELRKILNSDFGVWSLGAALVQPILTGGQVRAEKSKRKSQERQALANLQSTTLKAFGEVESALAGEKWLVKRISNLKEAVRLSEEAAEAAEQDYGDGTGDVLTLFTAENRRIELASQLATLRRARADVRVNLHLALGGGFRDLSEK